jgi:hypothetical protein
MTSRPRVRIERLGVQIPSARLQGPISNTRAALSGIRTAIHREAGFFDQIGSPGGASAVGVLPYGTGYVASYVTGR